MPRKNLDNNARIEIRTTEKHKELITEIARNEHTTVTGLLLRIFDLYYKENYIK